MLNFCFVFPFELNMSWYTIVSSINGCLFTFGLVMDVRLNCLTTAHHNVFCPSVLYDFHSTLKWYHSHREQGAKHVLLESVICYVKEMQQSDFLKKSLINELILLKWKYLLYNVAVLITSDYFMCSLERWTLLNILNVYWREGHY